MTNKLVPRDALRGLTVAVSVSDSADLGRLGLSPQHCDLAVAEVARAILIAGGNIAYGGRIAPVGFTQILIDEVGRFADDREALTIYLAASEHSAISTNQVRQFHRDHHTSIRVVCVDQSGSPVKPSDRDTDALIDTATALTAMRSYVSSIADAHVVVGGQLSGSQGTMPGIIEEVLLSLRAGRPIFVAGGFGGAAAALASVTGADRGGWAPEDYPQHKGDWVNALAEVESLYSSRADDGLTDQERFELAVTHRPADIASLTVLGLSNSRVVSRD